MFMCDVTKTPPYARNFVCELLFIFIRFNGTYDNVVFEIAEKNELKHHTYIKFYFLLFSENQCISRLDKIGIFIDMKFH